MENFVFKLVLYLVPMILAVTVHEFSHAWVAWLLGDDTAQRQGRLTLNPLAHIDPIGTLLVPVMGVMTGFPFIGWAKPVPISSVGFTRRITMKTGWLLTALAGPVSNMLFAILSAIILAILIQVVGISRANPAVLLLHVIMAINVSLAIFNLVPIPPLDGSKVLAGLLPDRYTEVIDRMGRYSFIFFLLIMFTPAFKVIFLPVHWILGLFDGLIGLRPLL